MVTGIFHHQSSNLLLNITVDGEDEPIGVTDNHPFWSEDRQQFVEAGQLEVGETLSTLNGTAKITSIAPRGPPEPVYNLEVQVDHLYHVADCGVLVHNGAGVTCSTFLSLDDFEATSDWVRVRPGPSTNPNAPHNATIRVQADLLEAGGNRILAGGRRLPERVVQTLGGLRSGRRPDIIFRTPSGQIRGRNVGLTDAAGNPIRRELEALDDLNSHGIPTDFVPYD